MPLPSGTRYRVVRRGGKKIRLAFRKGTNTVIETKVLNGTHVSKKVTPKKRKRRKRTY